MGLNSSANADVLDIYIEQQNIEILEDKYNLLKENNNNLQIPKKVKIK